MVLAKIKIVGHILALCLILLVPNSALAISGACSSHGGVNCSAQISPYSRVICNDGWTNSSVYYFESEECQASTCTPPSSSGCKTESDYSALQVKLTSSGSYLGYTSSHQSALTQCRNEINEYQIQYQYYQSCLNNVSGLTTPSYSPTENLPSQDSLCKLQFGRFAVASQKNPDSCTCVNGYGFSKSNGQCVPDWQYCVEDIGEPSYFDPTINACRCVSGYLIDSNKRCALADSVCEQKLGLGYWYDLDKKSCETCSKDTVRIGNLCLDSNILNAKTATSTLKDKIEKLHTEPDNFLVKNKQNVIPRSDDVQRIKDLEENAPKTQEAQTLEQVTTSTNVVKSEENTRAVRAWLGSILKSFFLLFGF